MRQHILQLLKKKDPQEKLVEEQQLYQQLFDLATWQQTNSIGITMSMPQEINTLPIIQTALSQNKQVYIPKTVHRELNWLPYNPQQLEKTRFGILEPTGSPDQAVQLNNIQLVLVPGVAFTTTGYRVGYGAGFYDRALTNYPGKTISLVLPEQQVTGLTPDPWDIAVEQLLMLN
ncbi:5-formyltetrahydrofolate cyclo-ligase [Liquorilactobacillus nagelii]|uniref:5-formyltetrahydrofolate cyclo-ligase n=1 Tax=Liquorilactobacillus nagelii TaxID=82688 RepID=UPI0021C390B1|nr:5-formyltetrahydrofolate cyclo-ligase [Liquorilactobacillus nagelii]